MGGMGGGDGADVSPELDLGRRGDWSRKVLVVIELELLDR
jgi:hypothetical protein